MAASNSAGTARRVFVINPACFINGEVERAARTALLLPLHETAVSKHCATWERRSLAVGGRSPTRLTQKRVLATLLREQNQHGLGLLQQT